MARDRSHLNRATDYNPSLAVAMARKWRRDSESEIGLMSEMGIFHQLLCVEKHPYSFRGITSTKSSPNIENSDSARLVCIVGI